MIIQTNSFFKEISLERRKMFIELKEVERVESKLEAKLKELVESVTLSSYYEWQILRVQPPERINFIFSFLTLFLNNFVLGLFLSILTFTFSNNNISTYFTFISSNYLYYTLIVGLFLTMAFYLIIPKVLHSLDHLILLFLFMVIFNQYFVLVHSDVWRSMLHELFLILSSNNEILHWLYCYPDMLFLDRAITRETIFKMHWKRTT